MKAVEVGPVPAEERTQSATDLFLILAGANLAAATMAVGSSLVPAFGTAQALALVAAGSLGGALLVAALAPMGPRLGVPSIVAARAALGYRGAQALAVVLYLTNFGWIALNNVIAASACAEVAGGESARDAWAVALGLAATAVVALGPRAVGRADRVAVPVMAAVGLWLLARILALPRGVLDAPGQGGLSVVRGLDVVAGYQASWLLIFADYSRYTRSGRRSAVAVWLALGLTSLWFMAMGSLAARATGTADPGPMLARMGLGAPGAVLLALGTVASNFVNVYLSGLAWRSLVPRTSDAAAVWSVGLIGVLFSLSRAWLDRYVDFMLLLGGLYVPVGGVFLARFFLRREPVDVAALYDPRGRHAGLDRSAAAAWALGVAAYYAAAPIGGTLPALATALLATLVLTRRAGAGAGRSR